MFDINIDCSDNNKSYIAFGSDQESIVHLENLNQVKNSISNSVLILASGPSALDIDFSKLQNITKFAVNGSAQLFLSHNIKPDYFVVDDLQ